MEFTIHFESHPHLAFDNSHSLRVTDSGVLEVTQNGDQKYLYSPFYWTWVQAGAPDSNGEA